MAPRKSVDFTVYVLVSLVLFFASANLSSQFIYRSAFVTLPNLVGKTSGEARAALSSVRVSVAIQGYAFDSRVEKGKIISQEPGPNSRLKARRTVKVIVSEGNELVSVPKLEGRSLEWASQTLRASGLRKGRTSQIHTPRFAAGRIIAQQPAESAVVGRNTPIDLLVGRGAWEIRYVMPDLIEKRAAPALRQLKANDFQVTEVHYSYYPGLDSGVVIKQSPAHGYRIQKRSQITIEVSR